MDYRPSQTLQQRWGGLKLTLRWFAFAAAAVLVANIGWLAWAKQRYGILHGLGTLQRGDCATSKRLNFWLHLATNALSSLLLSGSSAFMQAISAPTRKELDVAHAQGRWLHVGVLSFRNLRWISKRKGLVCLILATTSIPFHLLYNSLVFASLSSHRYNWAVVTEGFLSGAPFDATFSDYIPEYVQERTAEYANLQRAVHLYERIDPDECLRIYSNAFQGARRHVALVSGERNATTSILAYGTTLRAGEGSNSWVCSSDEWCKISSILASDTWEVYGHSIEYCLSEAVPETCSVQFSFEIMKVLIAFNALKFIAMMYILHRFDVEGLIVSAGDAAASFLASEDMTTHYMCLASKRDLDAFWGQERYPRPLPAGTRKWHLAVSRTRWVSFAALMTISLGLGCIGLAAGLFFLEEKGQDITFTALWEMGLGSLDANALVFVLDEPQVSTAITANIPQLFLALLYLVYNSIVTSMFVAADWSTFALKPQTLMVGSPAGKQRGTWFFGIPFAYGFPLLVVHVALHWLISQSLFAVQADVYDQHGVLLTEDRISNCGYSPIGIILTLVAGALLLMSAFVLGLRKFGPASPPVVSTCSAAISAACHPGYSGFRDRMVHEDLRWGETGPAGMPVGHCSLVPAELWDTGGGGYAREAAQGRLYA